MPLPQDLENPVLSRLSEDLSFSIFLSAFGTGRSVSILLITHSYSTNIAQWVDKHFYYDSMMVDLCFYNDMCYIGIK